MRSFHIQYASNLFVHLNYDWRHAKKLLTVGKAPNLALLGNIGLPRSQKTKDFIRWCSDNWDHVYCVPGPCELHHDDRLNGLFSNLPDNITILDQIEKRFENNNLVLLGCPLWTGHSEKIDNEARWSMEEKFFMAYKTPRQLNHWHDEDYMFLKTHIQQYGINYGKSQKVLLLTHNVAHASLLPPTIEKNRQIMLHDGNIYNLLGPNVIGCLSGAGGGSITGKVNEWGTFCGVNAAFEGPNMFPNRQYRPDMTASFPLDDWPIDPEGATSRGGRIYFPKIVPVPKLAVAYANPVLQ